MRQPNIRLFTTSLVMTAALAACGGGSDDTPAPGPVPEATPAGLTLEKIGGYSTGQFGVSAAEIPAFDAASKRLFVVNAQLGAVDVLDLSNPANPIKINVLDATAILAGAEINSVAANNGIVAVAIQAPVKTDPGRMALYRAADLSLISSVAIGAQPDMVTFTPDGNTVLVANEGEPSDDYQTDPEGSVSVIDVRDRANPVVRTASFTAFNGQEATLRAQGVRIYGPGATAAKDLEPEYIAVSADGTTAWVTLQENNALARVNIATATVTSVLPLGFKNHGVAGNELDASDTDGSTINIRTWPGVRGMYLPDAMASYTAGGQTYLVTANEGDARAWGEDNADYWNGDATKGFVEEFRVKHLVNRNGWATRAGDDLPPQLSALAAGGLLDPATFSYCGAIAGDPAGCRADAALGRLNISWTMGYRTNPDGSPMMFSAAGVADPAGTRLMYDNLYSYGARSFSIWNANGTLVWDSGSAIEKFLESPDCRLGRTRSIPCATYFNSGHDEGNARDSRSDAKGPEPEGLALGKIGNKTFAFIGLERMGGVLVYDITNPLAPTRVDYLNTRDEWLTDPPDLATAGDLGPEGLVFIAAKDSPNGKPLLVVGNEVSGTTAVLQLNLTY
ncbi:choice-of-anchor I family protein [Hydrogenophaga sp. IBVHS1]|uniref:choice-of-anchor I family protein n=1 Tax=unclassified Hydrogenophaga TaxID=2610897 RepID=UPI000A2E3D13|nr:choice-of-anchor I family protein [Hydrogenophaga sp. IBVHS1]OSZ76155.1 alkaline phosphatase [Hydrogenophaga sp. IBVHS1]